MPAPPSAPSSVATTWPTQHHQDNAQRLEQEGSRRERLFGEFIDEASKAYADGVIQERPHDPAKLAPMYTAMNKVRLFGTPGTIGAAEAVLEHVVETYETSSSALEARNSHVTAHDMRWSLRPAELVAGEAAGSVCLFRGGTLNEQLH